MKKNIFLFLLILGLFLTVPVSAQQHEEPQIVAGSRVRVLTDAEMALLGNTRRLRSRGFRAQRVIVQTEEAAVLGLKRSV